MQRRGRETVSFTITMYTKPGCHLCDDLLADLRSLQDGLGFAVVLRDIEDDADAFHRYQYLIPVLELPGGQELLPPHDLDRVGETIASAMRTMSQKP